MQFPRRVFSGIQPTGIPHLGNYCGAIANWVRLQEPADAGACGTPLLQPSAAQLGAAAAAPPSPAAQLAARRGVLYCVVDLHAMTMPYRASELSSACRLTAASLLACGIDPRKSILYRQSAVREHAELAWIFSCVTPLGWLNRMTQYKQKSGKEKDRSCLGLLSYPVLQAADILLYKGTHVPVGEDQHQHLELARNVAAAFNYAFCAKAGGVAGGGALPPPTDAAAEAAAAAAAGLPPAFPLPETISMASGATRVMSLRDGTKKMSKSDPDEGSRINLTDSAEAIRDKVRRAKTDSTTGFTYDPEGRPDKSNLLTIFSAVTGEPVEALAARYASTEALAFKNELADAIIALVAPIGKQTQAILADGDYVDRVLAEGADQARSIAVDTMDEVRRLTGL